MQQTAISLVANLRELPDDWSVQNFRLVWLDESKSEINNPRYESILKLQEVINAINIFVDVDECIDFISDSNKAVFVVIYDQISHTLIPILQSVVQVANIYVYCETKLQSEEWLQGHRQVSGIYTNVVQLCEALKQDTQIYDQNMSPTWLSMVFSDGRGQIFRRQSGLDFLAENSMEKVVC